MNRSNDLTNSSPEDDCEWTGIIITLVSTRMARSTGLGEYPPGAKLHPTCIVHVQDACEVNVPSHTHLIAPTHSPTPHPAGSRAVPER